MLPPEIPYLTGFYIINLTSQFFCPHPVRYAKQMRAFHFFYILAGIMLALDSCINHEIVQHCPDDDQGVEYLVKAEDAGNRVGFF